MEALEAYEVSGFLDWLAQLFVGLIPCGLLLGMLLALLGWGVFKAFGLIRSTV